MNITGGGYGHVAIAYQNLNSNSFISFDQNWNAQVGELITHDFGHVLGFLTPKAFPPAPVFEIKTKFNWILYARKLREKRMRK